MAGPHSHSDRPRLSRLGRAATGAVVLVAAGLCACIVHASLNTHRLTSALVVATHLRVNDLALTPSDHLRHPSWGRGEQGRAGVPVLPDPRAATMVVQPTPVEVTR